MTRLSPLVLPLAFAAAITAASCSVDLSGLLYSPYDVDLRFDESSALPEPADVSPAGSNFTFIAIADSHVYGRPNSNFQNLKAKFIASDSFVLMLGDLTQNGSRDDFVRLRDSAAGLGVSYYPVIGNHDLYFSGWPNYRDILGRSYSTFCAGQLRVVLLDTANGTLGGKQMAWLETVLSNRAEPCCVVGTHMNFFPPPGHVDDDRVTDSAEILRLLGLFQKYRVSLVLMGHDHSYAEWKINGVEYIDIDDFKDDGSKQVFRGLFSNGVIYWESFNIGG